MHTSDPNNDVIYYVNDDGTPTGETAPKLDAHTATTKLHAAFSCYVFNENGDFLVTQRALSKKVWPGVWTNSVCGHPAPDESRETAIQRRSEYELGLKLRDITVVLPNYTYTTPPFNGIIENEFCPVYVAYAVNNVQKNPEEVEDYKWISWKNYVEEITNDPSDIWSWWCKDQYKQLQNNKKFVEFIETINSDLG